jgi:hypothetical protein
VSTLIPPIESESIFNMTSKLGENIFKMKLFNIDFCSLLLEEIDNFEKVAKNELNIPIHRPNSMNNYGVILGKHLEFD